MATKQSSMLGFDEEKTVALAGAVRIYQEAFGGDKFALPMTPRENWPALAKDDPAFAAKAWFSLTIGRGALSHCKVLDEAMLVESLKLPSEESSKIAPGYYLVGPDGVCAAAYISDDLGPMDDPRSGENWDCFEQHTIYALKKAKAWDKESFCTRVAIDPEKLVSRDNLLGDALESGFGEDSFKKYGILCENKKDGESTFEPGFPSAWFLQGTEPFGELSVGSSFAIEAPFSEFQGAPFVNHNGLSFAKNIRPFAPVNNTDDSLGANQLVAREKIVDSLIDAWINSQRSLLGLADEENGIKASGLSDEDLQIQRNIAAKAYAGKLGNDKKLAYQPMKSCVRTDKVELAKVDELAEESTQEVSKLDEQVEETAQNKVHKVQKRSALIVSRDMAIIDGQHSSRNYGLLAMALASKDLVKWDGETVAKCSQEYIEKRFLLALGIYVSDKKDKEQYNADKAHLAASANDPKMKALVVALRKAGLANGAIFESFIVLANENAK